MTIDRRWYVAGAVVIAVVSAYLIGQRQGRLNSQLEANKTQIQQSDKHTDSVQIRTTAAHKQSDSVATRYTAARSKAKVVHDTVTVDSSHVYVDSTLAQIIVSADSTIAAQQRTIALQDTLISSLRVGLNLRDQRIKILEKAVLPSKASRFVTATKYLALGAAVGVAIAHR